jgi:TonB-dependent receptor
MALRLKILGTASFIALAAGANPALAQDAEGESLPSSTQTNQIVVTGIRASLGSAQDRKEAASAVVDSIVAEDIGKLPDNTVSDALQRVTGVQVSRGAGEAGTVLIRGLPNVTSYINGREAFTGTGRGVALQDIPAELVAGIDVYKTSTPELIEGGVAGRIDIRLRRPFDLEDGFTLAGGARALHSDKRDKWSYIVSGLASYRMESAGGQEFGVLLGGSYNARKYRDQTAFNFGFNPFSGAATSGATVLIPDTVGGLVTDGDRDRPALNASLQWRPSSTLEFYMDGIFTGYRNDFDVNFFVGLPKAGGVTSVETADGTVTIPRSPGATPTTAPAADAITTLNNFTITSKQAFQQKTDGYQAATGAIWTPGNTQFSTEVSYNHSTVESTSYIVDANYVIPRVDYRFNVNGTPNIRALNANGEPFDLSDTGILDIFAFFDQRRRAVSEQIAWRGDVAHDLDAGWLRRIKVGTRYAHRTGHSDDTGESRFPVGADGANHPGFGTVGPTDIIGGRLGVDGFALPSTSWILNNVVLLRELTGRPADPPPYAPALTFDLKEDNYAGYGQVELDFAESGLPLEVIAGARVVNLKTSLDAILRINGVLSPTSASRSDLEVLPSISFKARPAEDVVLRLVLGESMTAPEFAQLNPATNLFPLGATGSSSTFGSGSGGNPDLRPITTKNVDVTAEWYFSRTGSLTVSGFYRDLKDYIQSYVETEFFPTGPGGALQSYAVTRPRNTRGGELKGVEVAAQMFFDFLPGPLDGLGVQANFTYSDGEVEAPGRPGVMQEILQVSPYAYNIIGLYEKFGFSTRLAYSWRGKHIAAYDANIPGGFVEVDPVSYLDLSISYDVNPNVTVTFDATNLLNEQYQDSFGGYDATPRDTRLYDRTFGGGVRFRF